MSERASEREGGGGETVQDNIFCTTNNNIMFLYIDNSLVHL